jgi:hypothetical protein
VDKNGTIKKVGYKGRKGFKELTYFIKSSEPSESSEPSKSKIKIGKHGIPKRRP